jgi:hypothetical protein
MVASLLTKDVGLPSVFASCRLVLNNDGVAGFFVGLAPLLLSESLHAALLTTAKYVVSHLYLAYHHDIDEASLEKKERNVRLVHREHLDTQVFVNTNIMELFVPWMYYPFALVATQMAVLGSGAAGWRDTWSKIETTGAWTSAGLLRGGGFLARPVPLEYSAAMQQRVI